jgi:hypothetical protein
MALIEPCRELLKLSDNIQVGLIVSTVVCAGISAASTFQNGRRPIFGRETHRGFFLGFVKDYMEPILQQPASDPDNDEVKTLADWIYFGLRNGLAHCFTIEYGGVERGLAKHVVSGTGEPKVDLHLLLADFESGWNRMLDGILATPAGSLATNFSTRFDEVFRD